MFKKLIPDASFHNVTDISPAWLAERGIRALALDMDNTLARYSENMPAPEIIEWLNDVRGSGIEAVMVSNSHRPDRVSAMCAALGIQYTLRAGKPSPGGFAWAAQMLSIPSAHIAAVGDQIFTDIWGANRAGCFTILVYPRGMSENFLFRVRRFIEKPFIRKAGYKHGK